jgi:curved DNA-binding protein CbpA
MFYASVAGADYSDTDLSWPTTPTFTPYDIFRQQRNAPYSKRPFYELVKVYHPDRPCDGHPLCRDISEEVRLRRYRLVVAAHEILSDPMKRAAYDKDGTGWHNHPDRPDKKRSSRKYHRYGNQEDPIFTNGTWEEWERWHNRHQPKQVHVVSHRTFVTFILLMALFGGVAQASWITQYKTGFEQRIQDMNVQSAQFLADRRQQTTDQLKSREARVQSFLIRRDPSGYGLKEEEEGVYKQVLNPRHREPLASRRPAELKGDRVADESSNNDPTQ